MIQSIDAKNKLEDLSGVVPRPGENPYNALIEACSDRPGEIQSLYARHRIARNEQQKQKLLHGFSELLIDPILQRLEDRTVRPAGFKDPRNCLVLWARPPEDIIRLAAHLQGLLRRAAPGLWLMPTHRFHMTTLEVTHSRTAPEIAALVSALRPVAAELTNYTYSHRARLVKPMVVHDLAGVALSFLPAAGEKPAAAAPGGDEDKEEEHGEEKGREEEEEEEEEEKKKNERRKKDQAASDKYSYHHLRRDVWEAVRKGGGVAVDSRYVVPSAHITLGRFLRQDDHETHEARERWVSAIDDINAWLAAEVWDAGGGGGEEKEKEKEFVDEWVVGQERGLDLRAGTLWYGGGRTIMVGEGFL